MKLSELKELAIIRMTKFAAFLKAYDDVPSQDNEGYCPDRGSFKTGFFIAWDLRQAEIDQLKKKIRKLRIAGKKR